MTKEERRERKAERKAQAERLDQITAALNDERARLNQAIGRGAQVIITTHSGRYQVDAIDHNHWYQSHNEGSPKGFTNQHGWAGCNDAQWADMLKQAGLGRNELFA